MKTYSPKPSEIQEQWFLVDAEGQVVGRLAARIAAVLRGKNSPRFAPHANMRNHVVVINAEKIRLTGKKWTDKIYYRHSGWIGNLKAATARQLHEKNPTEILRKAIRGMLPHTRLGDATIKHLRLYAGAEHPHAAQKPERIDIIKKTTRKM